MLKVVFVTEQFPHPTETFVLAQMKGLLQRGCEVRVFTIAAGVPPSATAGIPSELLQHCTSLFRPGHLKQQLIAALPGMLLDPACWQAVLRSNLPFKQRILLALAVKRHQLMSADVVVVHFGTTAVFAQELIQAGVLRGKLVPFFHGYDLSVHATLALYQRGYQQLFAKADRVMTISQLWQDKLIQMGCPPDKLDVLRMGVSLHHAAPEHLPARPTETATGINLLTVARLTEKKGICYLLEALSVLKKKHIRFRARIIGSGPLLPELQLQTERLQLGASVEFCGVKTAAEVAASLADCDIFVLPSVTAANGDMEGIPVSLMEAMAAAKPCVSTFHSGIPELIADPLEGLLVPERDIAALAGALEQLMTDPALRSRLGLAARRKVQQAYDQPALDDKLYALLSALSRQTPHGC